MRMDGPSLLLAACRFMSTRGRALPPQSRWTFARCPGAMPPSPFLLLFSKVSAGFFPFFPARRLKLSFASTSPRARRPLPGEGLSASGLFVSPLVLPFTSFFFGLGETLFRLSPGKILRLPLLLPIGTGFLFLISVLLFFYREEVPVF